jgi:hypothetical protein
MLVVSSPWDADYLFLTGNEKLVISLKKLSYLIWLLPFKSIPITRFDLLVGCFFMAAFSGHAYQVVKTISSSPSVNGTLQRNFCPYTAQGRVLLMHI